MIPVGLLMLAEYRDKQNKKRNEREMMAADALKTPGEPIEIKGDQV